MSTFSARVIAVHKNRWEIRPASGDALEAILAGPELPVVGDVVQASLAEGDTIARIEGVEPRTSLLRRKRPGDVAHEAVLEQPIAANIDVALLAMCDDDFSVRRLERYLTLAWDAGTSPAVVLTKTDLLAPEVLDVMVAQVRTVAFGVPVIVTSATTGAGLDELRDLLPAGTCAILLGSSGVGKSTLLNALAGADLQATSGVRSFDGRGRHTTTSRRLVDLPWGAYLVDTPGLRELQIWGDEDALADSFADIEEIAVDCRFSDCTHGAEPGCAVRDAVAEGQLPEERFVSWQRLRKELAYLARRTDPNAARSERQKWRAISKQQKALKRQR